MGFTRSTSIHTMPGVTVTVSTTTITTFAGRTKVLPASPAGYRPSAGSTSGQPKVIISPAPGVPAPAVPALAPRPGLLAPREEKALYAYAVSGTAAGLDPAVLQHPVYGQAAAALLGVKQLQAGNVDACVRQLQRVIHAPEPVETNPFVLKYLAGLTFDLEIAGGVSARLPLTNAALTLGLAEALQLLQRGPEAVQYVEQLEPSLPALLSLTELYSERADWEEVLRLTDGVSVDSDLTALLAILRSQAHLELGHRVAAMECLKPVTAGRELSANVRFRALALSSNISLKEKAFSRAIADLERILAEDSQIAGIREAIARINERMNEGENETKQQAEHVPAASSGREAGFYPDPEGVAPFRYWDGQAWTSRVRMARL